VDTREWVKEELSKLGFSFPNSKSNFIFVTHPKVSAKELFEALKKENIYVRFLGGARIEEYLRISIGTREEMETLVSFLKNYISCEMSSVSINGEQK
jgi:histidinol-phosphate aminotransferase